jgi:hypothetical protein
MANLEIAQAGGNLIGFPDPVEAYGFLIPVTFETFFLIEDQEFDLRWSVELQVKIGEAGTASALAVTTRGFTNSKSFKKSFEDLESVERWQIEATANNLGDFLTSSLVMAIEFFRYEGTKEDWSIPLKIKTSSLDSGKWELGSRGFEKTDLKTLKKKIEKFQDKRAIPQEEHLITAQIVAEEVARAKATKTRSRHNVKVSDRFGLSSGSKGGQYRVQQARKAGYLTEDNKVSTPRVGKDKTTNKKKAVKNGK